MSKNPVLNPFAQSLGTPDVFMGFIAAASTLPGVLISLPAGSLSDVFGRKKILLASSIVFASAPFLYLFISSWWQLILVRFYHGFATATFIPVARATIAERYPSGKGEKISIFTSATIVGRSAAPFLGGAILTITVWDYHVLYLAVGVAGVTTLFVTSMLLKGMDDPTRINVAEASSGIPQVKTSHESAYGFKEVFRNLGIVVTSAIEAAVYYVYGTLEFFLSGYLKSMQFDPFLIGVISGMQLVLIPVVNPFMGRFSDRFGRKVLITMGLLISGLPLLVIPYLTDFLPILLISMTYGLGFSMVTSATPALVSDLAPKESYGTAMGFLASIMDFGQMLGPIITGLILATFGYSGSFFSLGAILLGFCFFFGIYQKLSTS
jgi:MFS family permease